MDREILCEKLGIDKRDLLAWQYEKGCTTVLYRQGDLYVSLNTEDIEDANEGSSLASESLEEAREEYDLMIARENG